MIAWVKGIITIGMLATGALVFKRNCNSTCPVKVIGIRPQAPVQISVSLKLMQLETLNFVINLPDVKNITK